MVKAILLVYTRNKRSEFEKPKNRQKAIQKK